MQFVIGLGNPGEQYDQTRHNAGWLVIDALRASLNAPDWRPQSKFHGELSHLGNIFLLKPSTFMNASGVAARSLVQFYDKELLAVGEFRQVWVIHDDLDLPLGSYKIQYGTGPKIHNGLLSLVRELGSEQFWHVRVGVDGRAGDRTLPGNEYVLQKFTADERRQLKQTVAELVADLPRRLLVE